MLIMEKKSQGLNFQSGKTTAIDFTTVVMGMFIIILQKWFPELDSDQGIKLQNQVPILKLKAIQNVYNLQRYPCTYV